MKSNAIRLVTASSFVGLIGTASLVALVMAGNFGNSGRAAAFADACDRLWEATKP